MNPSAPNSPTRALKAAEGTDRDPVKFNDDLWKASRLLAERRMASALILFDRLLAESRDVTIRFKRLRCYLPLGRSNDFEREADSLMRDYGAAGASAAFAAALDAGDLNRAAVWLDRLRENFLSNAAPRRPIGLDPIPLLVRALQEQLERRRVLDRFRVPDTEDEPARAPSSGDVP